MTEETGQAPADFDRRGLDGWFEGAVHVLPVRVYYEDTDAGGVVYHSDYLKYFERGRTNALRCLGVNHRDLAALDVPLFFVVAGMTLAYLKPARLDDELRVKTRFGKVLAASLEGRQALYRGGELLVKASVKVACVDGQGRPRRMPAEVRSLLVDHFAEERGQPGAADSLNFDKDIT